eukprot:SAG11_NODE_614_length_8201_cov_3.608121_2_plen_805_part_00
MSSVHAVAFNRLEVRMMGPQWMILGQAAGVAAAMAVAGGISVQDVDVGALRATLLARGQILEPPALPPPPPLAERVWFARVPMFNHSEHPLTITASQPNSLLKRVRSLPSGKLPPKSACRVAEATVLKLVKPAATIGSGSDRYYQVVLAAGQACPVAAWTAAKTDDLTIEDYFSRQRGNMVAETQLCVPGIAAVMAEFAMLKNKTLVAIGSRVHQPGCETSSGGALWWTLAALAPAISQGEGSMAAGGGSVLWETDGSAAAAGAVWAISACCAGARPMVFAKPIGLPGSITYPHDLPAWFTGTYWRQNVLASADDILADRLLSDGRNIRYSQIARVLPRLTGQMGETIEGQRHRGGPSFVSDPDSERWWQLRQDGAIVTGDTVPSGQSLRTINEPFHAGWTRPNFACLWPNHDGPDHGPQCQHAAGLLDGYLPVINMGVRDTSDGGAYEQMVLASGDSVFVANRTGNESAGEWHQWQFFKSVFKKSNSDSFDGNTTERLIPSSASSFISALVSTISGATDYMSSTALSEARIEISAEPLLADAARACVLLSRATFVGLHPKYGVGPQYWKNVNDAFPPTTLATALTLGSIGAPAAAADKLGYFLERLVDAAGDVQYYGTAMSELGQLLQAASSVVVGLDAVGTDAGDLWLNRHAAKLGAIAEKLLMAQHNATQNRGSSHGLLWGCPEADLCSTPEGQGLFFTSSLWAWRGLNDLVGVARSRVSLGNTSVAAMREAAARLLSDSTAAIVQVRPYAISRCFQHGLCRTAPNCCTAVCESSVFRADAAQHGLASSVPGLRSFCQAVR